MEAINKPELNRAFLTQLSEKILAKDKNEINILLSELNAADIALLLDNFSNEESKFVFDTLSDEQCAHILENFEEDYLTEYLPHLSHEELSKYLSYLDSDDAADILYLLPLKDREIIIGKIENEEKAQYILDLLRYDENVAGGIMAKELIKANVNWSVKECINEIRIQAENVDKIYSVYVVNNADKLLGKVSLKKILLSYDHIKVADIFDNDLVSVETYMESTEVAQLMQKYDFDAVPVVNGIGKLVGRITHDDILDVVKESAEEVQQIMSGISADVEEDDGVWKIIKSRLPWLIVGMIGGIAGAQFLGLYEAEIMAIPAVAFFIPLITATGGNVGIQSSAIIVQTLANTQVVFVSIWKRLLKVFIVALLNGIILGSLVFISILILNNNMFIAATVSIALLSVVFLASLMGTITPLVLNKLGINPAVASGPFITTTNDLIGLAVYFMVANFIYNS